MLKHYTEFENDFNDFKLPFVKNNKGISFANIECGFDIETTSMLIQGEEFAFMYVWALS